jgi:staphylococcal nuclease domain-containing protein 1
VAQLVALEEEAKTAQVGVWADTPRNTRHVHQQLEGDARVFLEEHRGKAIDAIVEQVRDGSTLRVQLIYPGSGPNDWIHQYVVLLLSGIKAPVVRTGIPGVADTVEPFGEEAKFFVESRLLQREVKVKLEGK